MKRYLLIFSFIFFFLPTLFAESADTSGVQQDVLVFANRAFGLGVGGETHHVSYLSPLKYSGTSLEFWNESIRKSGRNGKWYSILSNRAHYSALTPTSESTEMTAVYNVFEFHKFYNCKLTPNFKLLCGFYTGFEIGADLLFSNSNNPIYVRGELNLLGLSLCPTLNVKTKRRVIKISDQLDLRLAGIVFSPRYTQLYYDLTLSDYDKTEFIDFNSFSEKMRFSNKLMVELPLRKHTLRLGMLVERSKSMINLIDNRTTNIQALIGFSYDYFHLKGRFSKGEFEGKLKENTKVSTVFE